MFGSIFNGREESNEEDSSSSSRRVTRSQSNPPTSSHLAAPAYKPLGARRPPSPSPSSLDSQFSAFSFPTTQADMAAPTSEAQIQAMVQAATQAALAALQATGSHKRKPDLPNFDPNNVEIWIRRVESAFIRANVTAISDKFAYLETKFSVDQDPKVNEFLFGEMSENQWRGFLTYLRNRYGKSVKSQCTAIMRGFQRDGRRPSDMLAHIRQETAKVTLDDLYKEMVLSSLPQDVQRTMADRVQGMTADETVALADNFFDKDGKVLHPSSGPAISAIDSREEEEGQEEEADVNAIRSRRQPFKKPPKKQFQPSQQQQQQQRQNFTPAHSNPPSRKTSASASASAAPGGKSGDSVQPTCRHHARYGNKAYTCEQGCHLYPGFKGKQGNGNAGSRL